ncbi:MAG: carboxyltransferase domain-containing protein, partial [Gaiellales bacterium]
MKGSSAIIGARPASGDRPSITYRLAGDRAVLVGYGEMTFDLRLNFFVLSVDAALRDEPIAGVVETAPGFRSMLVTYDPRRLTVSRLVEQLESAHDGLRAQRDVTIPSRRIRLPVAFDDSQCTQAVARYRHSIRDDAPNCRGNTNIDYTVAYNGLESREQLYESVLATDQWAAFIGFFPGLPFLFPLDPRHAVTAPKYNPTRTWTAEGAVGLGGPCWSIYPVESAGGYQLVGRTLPVYDLAARNAVFRDNPLLLRAGDRVLFHRVGEDELLAARNDVHADRYVYDVEAGSFDVGAHIAWSAGVAAD